MLCLINIDLIAKACTWLSGHMQNLGSVCLNSETGRDQELAVHFYSFQWMLSRRVYLELGETTVNLS